VAAAAIVVIALAVGAFVLLTRDPVERARQAGRGGNVLEGIEILDEHTVNNPEDATAHLVMGQLYWQSGDYARAAEKFNTASRLDPGNEEAALLSVVAAAKGKTTDHINTQIAALQRLVEKQPQNTRALYMLGLALGAIGDHVGQVNALERALAQADTAIPEETLRTQLAVAQALQGQTAAASEQAARAGALVPGDANITALQGFLASLSGDKGIAEATLEQVAENAEAFGGLAEGRLGLAHLKDGRYSDALALLRKAKNAPDAPPAADFYHALALQMNGLDAEALTAYDTIINEKGKFAGEAALQMAVIYLDQNKPDPAGEALRRAQMNNESSARLYTLQGRIAMVQGNIGEAQNSYRQALQLDSDYAPAHLENGLVFVARGSLAEGVRELRQYLDLVGPDNPNGRYPEIELLVNQLEQASSRPQTMEAARAGN
jgi:tetratricopeptide (TPR) repeat protein